MKYLLIAAFFVLPMSVTEVDAHPVSVGCGWGGLNGITPDEIANVTMYYVIDLDWTNATANNVASDPWNPNNMVSPWLRIEVPDTIIPCTTTKQINDETFDKIGPCFYDEHGYQEEAESCTDDSSHPQKIPLCYESCTNLPIHYVCDAIGPRPGACETYGGSDINVRPIDTLSVRNDAYTDGVFAITTPTQTVAMGCLASGATATIDALPPGKYSLSWAHGGSCQTASGFTPSYSYSLDVWTPIDFLMQ